MNAREAYYALTEGNEGERQRALLKLLAQVEALSEAVLGLVGRERLATGEDPLTMRSRVLLGDFIGLPEQHEGERKRR